ncbi:MAG: aminodeoxychorismate/anthranilate synthase component II [Lentisphaeria bacterium]|nr:aminodeoxychorismate/anthranilate synthase component II [Lentisphaeria bacterium]
MIFVLDNYDSFTYNLVHLLYSMESEITVRRNRKISVAEVLEMNPEAIILSPGPGRPAQAGIMPELIRAAAERKIPMLGVCLGHQGIGEAFGAKVVPAKAIMHGKISAIEHDGKGLFTGMTGPFNAVRYHSLALDEATLPPQLEVTCRTADGEIMGVRHRSLLIEGIQYHPESILTASGKRQLSNFMQMVRAKR